MNYNQIISRVNNLIKDQGILKYIKKWKPSKIPTKFKNYNHFIKFLNTYVKSYHFHSSLILKNSKNNRQSPDFYYDHKIGCIKFYQFDGSEQNPEFSKIIKETKLNISKWIDSGMSGLIIDLSRHLGGHIYPALYGLYDILGSTTLYGLEQCKMVKNDKGWINLTPTGTTCDKFKTGKLKFNKPIAVIVSKNTKSSGEILASIFIGRKNTIILGKNTCKTFGKLSVNNTININNKINMAVTVNLVTTVDGKFHKNEVIKVKKSKTPIKDAKKWITSQSPE